MRLTLRTLLAYLDDVLPATQAREIGEKIEESPVAGSLISRIREVMRRRRLTAPTLTGPGAGIDANAVAEYLDNTLPPDGVADVEKICLESDIHLAEVAACHQILPLVLGERVDMPPRLRERMYGLGPSVARVEVVGSAPSVHEAGELEAAALNSVLSQAPAAPRPKPLGPPQPLAATAPKSPAMEPRPVPVPGSFQDSLPDYLRPKRDFKKTAGYAAALLVLLAWGFLTFRNSPFGSGQSAEDANGPGKDRRLAQAQDRGVGANPDTASDSPGDDETEPTDAGDASDSSAEPISNQSTPDKARGKSSPTEGRGATGNRVADSEGDSGKPRGPKASPPTSDLGDAMDDAAPPYRKKDKAQPKGKDLAGKSNPPAKSKKEADDDQATQESPAEPQPPKSIGKYVSTDGVALRFSPSDEGWHVIPTGTQIDPGADLAAPTPFEAALELNGGSVTLLPGTSISWMGENGGGPLGIQLRQGRVLIRPNSSGHKRPESLILGVALGGTLWRVELSPDAVCGLESMPPLPSRFEQTATTMGGLSSIHLASGRAKLVQTGADEFATEMTGPASLMVPVVRPSPEEKWPQLDLAWLSPEWMSNSRGAAASKSIAALFEKNFSTNEPVELTIPGATNDSNPRISELATSCLSLIGEPGALVKVLQTTKHEESRQTAILGLRAWLLADESNRDLLKTELERRYPVSESDIVYQLLWGYRDLDAQSKATSTHLIEWMGHREPSIRALAFHHVKSLTGRDFGYHANGSDLQRSSALKQWRQHLNRNEGCLVKPKALNAPGSRD